ncbi:hypothetical protein PpSQ1_03475 [Pseudomonas putida]|nr:hypothetical protein PpSQ1_03475 [Pseudomonas putida]
MASIQRLPSGKWRALIRKKGITPISATFETEKLAKERERQLEEIKATDRTAAPRVQLSLIISMTNSITYSAGEPFSGAFCLSTRRCRRGLANRQRAALKSSATGI